MIQRSELLLAALLCGTVMPMAGSTGAPRSSKLGDALYRRALAETQQQAQDQLVRDFVFQDHSTWEDPWIVTVGSFRIRTVDRVRGMRVAKYLDKDVLPRLQELFGDKRLPSQPFDVWIVPSPETYGQYGEDNGDEHSSFLGGFVAAGLDSSPAIILDVPDNVDAVKTFAAHTTTHQYLQRTSQTALPIWLTEGLASYMALGVNPEWAAQRHRELASRYLPIEQLLRDSRLEDFNRQADIKLHELGMLFRYFLEVLEDDGFRSFLAESLRSPRRAEQSAFFQVFKRDMRAIEEDLRNEEFRAPDPE